MPWDGNNVDSGRIYTMGLARNSRVCRCYFRRLPTPRVRRIVPTPETSSRPAQLRNTRFNHVKRLRVDCLPSDRLKVV